MKKIKVGVVPAAGKGRRLNDLLLTKVLPKPMLPILNKPILEYVIENMKSIGIEEVYIIVGPKKEIIQEYFADGEDFNLHITYVEQQPSEGIAHAIGQTKDYISEPFMVILGDDLTIARSLSNLAETFWKKSAWVVEGVVPEKNLETIRRTCCVTLGNTGEMTEIVEKPLAPKSNLRGVGVYLFDPKVFDFIEATPISNKRNEKEISDTIDLIAKEGRAYGALINGININVNTYADLLEATKMLLNLECPSNNTSRVS